MELVTTGDQSDEANINPERLDLAMRMAGVRSVAALAASLGKHEATVRNWTKERAQPHRSTLDELCGILAITPGFLTEPTAPPALHDSYFRSTSRTMRATHERIGGYAVLFGMLVRFLTGSANLKTPKLGPPSSAATAMRDRAGLSPSEPVPDTIELAWSEGIATAFAPLDDTDDSAKVDAFSARIGATPVIVLNPGKGDYYRQRFDVAHEIGHLVMHVSSEAMTHSERESQAHDFASRLLFPRTPGNMILLGKAVSESSFDGLFAIQSRWGISIDALLHVATTMLTGGQRAAAREKSRAVRSGELDRARTRGAETITQLAALVAETSEDSSFEESVSFVSLQSGVPRDYLNAMLISESSAARHWPAQV